MKALLDLNGLDRRPHNISSDLWYYEEKAGLKFYGMVNGRSVIIGIIQWRSIAASLRRHDAMMKKRVKKPVGKSHRAILRESGIVANPKRTP